MHKTLLRNHNELVKPEDTLYIIGDVYWKNSVNELRNIMENYNGNKILVLGNHDRLRPFDYLEAGFSQIATCLWVERFLLVHDPAAAAMYPDTPVICGHVHGLFKKVSNVLNVGVNVWDFKPVSMDQVKMEFGII
jgi:calcineurin-like phosphoesterase family protein